MYSDDSMIAAQKKMMSLQKKALALQKKTARAEMRPQVVQDIDSILFDMNKLENDINLTLRDVVEFMSYTGNSSRNIPSTHNISPFARRLLSDLKKLNMRDVSEKQLRELNLSRKRVIQAGLVLGTQTTALRQLNRPKDRPYLRLYEIAREDLINLIQYMSNSLRDIAGHNYFTGSGVPKRFL